MFKKFIYSICLLIGTICFLFSVSFKNTSKNSLSFPIKGKYYISSPYGYRNLFGYRFHNGIDIPKPEGTPVYPISSGTVSHAGFSTTCGDMIVISYYNNYKSLYCHMNGSHPFNVGDSVTTSDVVGYVGPKTFKNKQRNGYTTGPHLHFTLYYKGKTIDPSSITYE